MFPHTLAKSVIAVSLSLTAFVTVQGQSYFAAEGSTAQGNSGISLQLADEPITMSLHEQSDVSVAEHARYSMSPEASVIDGNQYRPA